MDLEVGLPSKRAPSCSTRFLDVQEIKNAPCNACKGRQTMGNVLGLAAAVTEAAAEQDHAKPEKAEKPDGDNGQRKGHGRQR